MSHTDQTAIQSLNLAGRLVVCLALLALIGCGMDPEQLADLADPESFRESQSRVRSAIEAIHNPDAPSDDASTHVSVEPNGPTESEQEEFGPYPERSNPFEFAMIVNAESQNGGDELMVKLFGFVGDDSPKAIVNMNGKTKLMSVGDRWGSIEIVEIEPPTIRFRAAGIINVRSLLGNGTSE